MKKITKIKNAIKRKVNESRLRGKVSSILEDALPNILAELNQLDQGFLNAKPVKEEEDLDELDVRKTHGDRRIENPKTGNDIKLRTALKAKKGSAVYQQARQIYNQLKDKPANEQVTAQLKELKELLDINERAYASTDGKPYFDYDPGQGKLTEAKRIKPHDLGYRMNVRRAKADFKKGENIAAVSKQGLGSFKIEDQNDFNKYHPLQWDFAYIVKEDKMKKALDTIKTGEFMNETKSAPAGHYFTKGGNVVKGRLSKAARAKGATKSDPKDKQRSKVPPATQRNESAKDKFGAPPMNKWWTGSKESLMSAIYHAQRQLPPTDKAKYEKNWKSIVKQLQRKYPAPTAIYRKRLNEDYSQRARNFRVALRRRLEAMKKGKKIKYGKLAWTALGNGNFKDSRGRTVPYQDIVQDLKFAVQPDIMQHRGAAGDGMVDAYLKFEGKLNEDHFKKGQKVKYQLDRGSSKALRPSTGTISNIKKMGNYYQYTIQDSGPVPVWGAEIIGLAESKLTEAKFYVTYNQGRGMGKRVVTSKESDYEDPRVFRNYNDAERYVKMAKSGGGTPGRITAYWVSDINMNRIDKAGRRI